MVSSSWRTAATAASIARGCRSNRSVTRAMLSDAFEGFYLSDLEYGVRTHHNHLRDLLPVLSLDSAPEEKDMATLNSVLLTRG